MDVFVLVFSSLKWDLGYSFHNINNILVELNLFNLAQLLEQNEEEVSEERSNQSDEIQSGII